MRSYCLAVNTGQSSSSPKNQNGDGTSRTTITTGCAPDLTVPASARSATIRSTCAISLPRPLRSNLT